MVTGPSEPFALMSAVTVAGGGAGATTLIVTESVVEVTPSVQLMVSVVDPPTAGYHGWPEGIGPPEPEREIPESPVGEVRVQAVASPDDQL
jgi:hypothetical protein